MLKENTEGHIINKNSPSQIILNRKNRLRVKKSKTNIILQLNIQKPNMFQYIKRIQIL